MKVTIDTHKKYREDFFERLEGLVKSLQFHGMNMKEMDQLASEIKAQSDLGKLSTDEMLRLEIMTGNLVGVICALTIGADPDYTVNGVSNRRLALAYKRHQEGEKIVQAIEELAPPEPARKLKRKPRPTAHD